MSVRRIATSSVAAVAGLALAILPAAFPTALPAADASLGRADDWEPPVVLGPDGRAAEPSVVTDAAGNDTALWRSVVDGRKRVVIARRPAGGVWSAPVALWQRGQDVRGTLAVGASGEVTALWVTERLRQGELVSTVATARLRDEVWSRPTVIRRGGTTADSLRLVVGDRGDALAAWHEPDPVYYASSVVGVGRSPDGAWSQPMSWSSGEATHYPQVGLAADGTGVVSFAAFDGHDLSAYAFTWDGHQFGDRTTFDSYVVDPRLAVAPDGSATLAWVSHRYSAGSVRAQHRSALGVWEDGDRLVSDEPPSRSAGGMALAAGPDGTTVAAWVDYRRDHPEDPQPRLRVAELGEGGWSTPVTAWQTSAPVEVEGLALVVGPTDWVLAWRQHAAGQARGFRQIRTVVRAGGVWEASHRISRIAWTLGLPTLAGNASGRVLAAWDSPVTVTALPAPGG